MKNVLFSFVATRSVVGKKTIFHINNKDLIVEAPHNLMKQLAILCDGKRSIDQVIEIMKDVWDEKSLRDFIKALCNRGILIDGSAVSEEIWKFVEDPIGFPLFLTEAKKVRMIIKAKKRQREGVCGEMYQASPTFYTKLLETRRSIRSFSGKIPFQSIINMLWSAYGDIDSERRTVPSAGALYPLILHVVFLQQPADCLIPAIYRVYFGPFRSVGFKLVSTDLNCFERSLNNPMMLKEAQGAVVISGSFRITAEKYGSRSILFVVLEAGHVAQNINIAAVENNIATVEIGGFKERILIDALKLPKYYHPLIITVFGKEDKESKVNFSTDKIQILWQTPSIGGYYPPFIIVSARFPKKRNWSHGRDVSLQMAYVKAITEAKERAACGCIPSNLVEARFIDLENAIDPRSIIKFHPTQYRLKGFPFKPFNEKIRYKWTEGRNEMTGSKVYILADHVYFPYFPKTPYYCYANSSGVAAHPERQKAVEKSLFELVERDSFMIAYLTRLQFPTVQESTLPESFRKRLKALRKVGFKVWIKDHSIDLIPVVCIIAQSNELTCTLCASCASFDIEYAVDHALMEIEALIFMRLQNGPGDFIKPKEVKWPRDHGRIYNQKQYFRHADFLIYSQTKIPFQEIGLNVARSMQQLLDRFVMKKWNFYTVSYQLSKEYGGNDNLYIIRSIVPGMVPMTFGFRQEPAGMERIYTIAKDFGKRELFYRDLTKFPHPFT